MEIKTWQIQTDQWVQEYWTLTSDSKMLYYYNDNKTNLEDKFETSVSNFIITNDNSSNLKIIEIVTFLKLFYQTKA